MELQGTVKKIFDTQTLQVVFKKKRNGFIDSGTISSAYFNRILSDKINLLDNVSEGETVKLESILEVEWTNPQGEVKYFNSITAWRLEK